ncbi:hypothetical protein CAPTEDRAFT_186959 [Capitella teleta]|uniref:G-protein coupled receptors family 1 profile domain-containing protein n=1 Tax=Capitella teleta TaxID=283909 RepID=R7TND4_CAPTE|nr:hypothetical protein CAPTEDRAFT_186959 [Capitella teleta]|eukprot:ELT92590.1 hypothetical protein CAPTEDRAFT_186959 [Capitella teleta]
MAGAFISFAVWLFAAAILQLLSASCTVFSLLAFCAVNGWEPYRRSMSVGLAALISCTVADGCLLASLVLVGHNVSFPSFIPAIFEAQLGWAYYVSTLNTLSLAVSTGMLMRYTYVIKNLPVVYEEIPDFPNDY